MADIHATHRLLDNNAALTVISAAVFAPLLSLTFLCTAPHDLTHLTRAGP